jgi:zinc-binding in reverse transcriptase
MDGGCINFSMSRLLNLKLLLKVRCFVWLVIQNKILTTNNLCRKSWVGPLACVFYSVNETVNHLFLTCPFVLDFWCAFNECNNRNVKLQLSTVSDLWEFTLQLS